MEEQGFITLHRKVLKAAIWQNINDWRLASYLLLKANWEPGEFQARSGDVRMVPRGSLVTSLKSIIKGTGLSFRETRTSLLHLAKADFLTSETTNHFRVIKIIKYSHYQDRNKSTGKQNDKHPTSTRQAPDNDIKNTTIKPLNKTDTPQQVREYVCQTHEQRIMGTYKLQLGLPYDDRGWDKAQYKKWIRHAHKLLAAFGISEPKSDVLDKPRLNAAIDYFEGKVAEFKNKALSWNLATIAGSAWNDSLTAEYRRNHAQSEAAIADPDPF